MITIKFEILNKEWVLRVLKRKKYNRTNGNDSVAITDGWKRRIDIAPNGVDYETLVHELVHAYLVEMCVKTTNEITVSDLEEVYAELMAKRGRELLDLADKLMVQIEHVLQAKITFVVKEDD
jgi:hypothetical protein